MISESIFYNTLIKTFHKYYQYNYIQQNHIHHSFHPKNSNTFLNYFLSILLSSINLFVKWLTKNYINLNIYYIPTFSYFRKFTMYKIDSNYKKYMYTLSEQRKINFALDRLNLLAGLLNSFTFFTILIYIINLYTENKKEN